MQNSKSVFSAMVFLSAASWTTVANCRRRSHAVSMRKKKPKYSLLDLSLLNSWLHQIEKGILLENQREIIQPRKLQQFFFLDMSLPASWHPSIVKHPCDYHKPSALKITANVPSKLLIRNAQPSDCSNSLFPPANQSVAAIIFGDGSPSRLYPLTKRRSEAAIPIAGNYRLIDAVVSNCINSNISKIYALTQFNSTSLNSHLSRAYSGVFLGKDGFVEVLAACQTPENKGWFQGTADAIRKCFWVLEEYPVFEFLILPGHHLYKMNYQKLIEAHRNNNADITVAVLSSRKDESAGFGSFRVNSKNEVVEFIEDPQKNQMQPTLEPNLIRFNGIDHDTFPSMGIYVINRDIMTKLLIECFPTANDLRGEIIPGAISLGMKIHALQFDGYWEDMRSIEAFYHANMESTKKANNSTHNFYDRDSPIYTLPRNLPPTLITDAVITDSIVGDGCVLDRCNIKGTVVGMRTRIGEGATVEDSIIMGSDTYPKNGVEGNVMRIPIGIGEGSFIRKAIVDKNARIGKNVKIINKDKVVEGNKEAEGYIVTGGIVVVIRSAVISDGSIL